MSDLPSAVLLIGAAELEGELQVGNVITPLQLTPSHHHTTTSTLVRATRCISRSESGNVQLSTNCRVKYSSDLLLVHHTHCIVACCRLGKIILQNINISIYRFDSCKWSSFAHQSSDILYHSLFHFLISISNIQGFQRFSESEGDFNWMCWVIWYKFCRGAVSPLFSALPDDEVLPEEQQ